MELLKQSARQCVTPIVIFLDALDLLEDDYQPCTLDWIEDTLPKVQCGVSGWHHVCFRSLCFHTFCLYTSSLHFKMEN